MRAPPPVHLHGAGIDFAFRHAQGGISLTLSVRLDAIVSKTLGTETLARQAAALADVALNECHIRERIKDDEKFGWLNLILYCTSVTAQYFGTHVAECARGARRPIPYGTRPFSFATASRASVRATSTIQKCLVLEREGRRALGEQFKKSIANFRTLCRRSEISVRIVVLFADERTERLLLLKGAFDGLRMCLEGMTVFVRRHCAALQQASRRRLLRAEHQERESVARAAVVREEAFARASLFVVWASRSMVSVFRQSASAAEDAVALSQLMTQTLRRRDAIVAKETAERRRLVALFSGAKARLRRQTHSGVSVLASSLDGGVVPAVNNVERAAKRSVSGGSRMSGTAAMRRTCPRDWASSHRVSEYQPTTDALVVIERLESTAPPTFAEGRAVRSGTACLTSTHLATKSTSTVTPRLRAMYAASQWDYEVSSPSYATPSPPAVVSGPVVTPSARVGRGGGFVAATRKRVRVARAATRHMPSGKALQAALRLIDQ